MRYANIETVYHNLSEAGVITYFIISSELRLSNLQLSDFKNCSYKEQILEISTLLSAHLPFDFY